MKQVKLPRKLKKALKKEHGDKIVKDILSGVLIYKSRDVSVMTETGWKTVTGKKSIFMNIQ